MHKTSLNGSWTAYGADFKDIAAVVPGCIHTDLMENGLIEDPYYRDNETGLMWIGQTDWTYERAFHVDESLLIHKHVNLVCHGLDTFARIYVNENEVIETDNMFRTWECDVKPYLRAGENGIKIVFASTYPYMEEKIRERWLTITGINHHRITGSNYVRKMQCNYGWDWGPMCVTAGIWRDIEIEAYDSAKIEDVHIRQKHGRDRVDVHVETNLSHFTHDDFQVRVTVGFAGETVGTRTYDATEEKSDTVLTITEPKLWWPNNLGEQNLYDVKVELIHACDRIDEKAIRIGLRTLVLDRHGDEWGESFQFKINGVPFFAKGANWIPIDTFVTRGGRDFYRQLLTDAGKANMNFIRVWGGGIYEQDVFYELCDELGLCVWQDFMFACSAYPVYDEKYINTFRREAIDTIKRLRPHPCLALWCGNNEIEQMGNMVTEEPDRRVGTMNRKEYSLLFEDIIPGLIGEYDGEHDYWISSPHTPGKYGNDPNEPAAGDAHLWDVWHGRKPFEWYRTCEHRFNSEFGFQSFPEPDVVYGFTQPEDRNITSYVMEKHQRSGIGNDAIVQYMLSWFRLPAGFDMLLWTSQILQSLAIKYAVEHWRRKMPQGMGTLYWQLNDCWPAASWSSIDYTGNWKALHYSARKFFSPILLSGVEDNKNLTVDLYLSNDTLVEQKGRIQWTLYNFNGQIEDSGGFDAAIRANSSSMVMRLDVSAQIQKAGGIRDVVLFYSYIMDGRTISENTALFTRPKHMKLQKPIFDTKIIKTGDTDFDITISSDKPALWVWPEIEGMRAKYSDRFFDMGVNRPKTVSVTVDMTLEEFRKALRIYSIADTYRPIAQRTRQGREDAPDAWPCGQDLAAIER